jgi:hypothetical protein
MSRTINSVLTVLAFAILVFAASAATAQTDRVRRNPDDSIVRAPTLGCCRCLGGSNTLDLSTISSNNWTVAGNPVAFLTTIHPLWNLPPARLSGFQQSHRAVLVASPQALMSTS